MRARVEKIRLLLRQKMTAGFFVTNPRHIFYLTGFVGISPHERESSLLITQDSIRLFIPKMYAQVAEKNKRLTGEEYEIVVDHERHGLLTSFTRFVDAQNNFLCESNNLTLTEFEKMQASTPAKLVPVSGAIEELRLTKDDEEISRITKAVDISDRIFSDIQHILGSVTDFSTLTELDLVDAMRSLGREYGADGFGFDPIVAVGAHAAEPHYHTGRSRTALEPNTCLLLDFGFAYGGYTSDITRTIFLGKAPAEFRRIYTLVKECSHRCIEQCRPGVSTRELFDFSYRYFKENGVADRYLHSLGHGIGLDVHEAPSLGSGQATDLAPGMVVTIEPGLYLEKSFGVRIEDDVLITETGCEVLTKSTRDLVEIG